MAAKIVTLLALLALSISAATAAIIPSYISPLSATISQYFPSFTNVGSVAFATGITPLSAVALQQPFAFPQQQFFADVTTQGITALQHQQQQQLLPYFYNQLAVANPAAYWQQQQLLPFNQPAMANYAAFFQQQQSLPLYEFAVTSPTAFWQQPIIGGAFF